MKSLLTITLCGLVAALGYVGLEALLGGALVATAGLGTSFVFAAVVLLVTGVALSRLNHSAERERVRVRSDR